MNTSLEQLSSKTSVVVHIYIPNIQEAETEGLPQLWGGFTEQVQFKPSVGLQ